MTDLEVYEEQAQIAPQQGGVFAVRDPAEMIQHATAAANALHDVVEKRDLVKNISGKRYLLAEAWTTLGVLVGCTARTAWSRKVTDPDGWEARVEVVNANGIVIGAAESQCTRSENLWGWEPKGSGGKRLPVRDDFALRSMAQTRAMGKALRMPLGWIAVLAGYEATPADEMPANPPATPQPASEPVVKGARGWEHLWELLGECGIPAADAEEWVRQAVREAHGIESLKAASPDERRLAFRQANDALILLTGAGDLAFSPDARAEIREAFAQTFGGVQLEGPPWRLGPNEPERPTKTDWDASQAA